jgi:hypothetical protein
MRHEHMRSNRHRAGVASSAVLRRVGVWCSLTGCAAEDRGGFRVFLRDWRGSFATADILYSIRAMEDRTMSSSVYANIREPRERSALFGVAVFAYLITVAIRDGHGLPGWRRFAVQSIRMKNIPQSALHCSSRAQTGAVYRGRRRSRELSRPGDEEMESVVSHRGTL